MKYLYLVITLIIKFSCVFCDENACNWVNRVLQCRDVEYTSIISMNGRNFTSAEIYNCNLYKWEKTNQLAFVSSLTTVKLHCNIYEVTEGCLESAEKLQVLDLSSNVLNNIPPEFFPPGNHIKILNLHGNKIKFSTTNNKMFKNLNKLEKLDLSQNRINLIGNALHPLENLLTLNLSGNVMNRLVEGTFDYAYTKNLKNIDLSFNYIHNVDENIFCYNFAQPNIDLRHKRSTVQFPLEELNLQNNLLQEIPKTIFSKMHNLRVLNIANNRIDKLEENTFVGMVNLKKLFINGNPIKFLPNTIFQPLINLEELDMSNMKLSSLPQYLFTQNMLKRLDFSYNDVKSIDVKTFQPLTKMVYLNMSHNRLETFSKGLFEGTSEEHSLQIVDFSWNKVHTLEPDIYNMESLLEVHARGNHLKFIDPGVFSTCTFPVLYVDFRDNRLVNMDLEFFDWVPNLEQFEMTGNPWECKCFDKLLQFLSKRHITYTKARYFEGQESTCIALNPFECKVDEKHYDKYYDLFVKANLYSR